MVMNAAQAKGFEFDPLVGHDVTVGERRVLFHIPTTGLFDLDPLSAELLDALKDSHARSRPLRAEDLRGRFDGRYHVDEVLSVIEDFTALGVIRRGAEARGPVSLPKVEKFPLSTIVLNMTTGCNLACGYCYKEDLATPKAGEDMDFETAVEAIELLLAQSGPRDRVNIVFFGGEPLRKFREIRRIVEHAERRCGEAGKIPDFSLTTNATLLTEEIVDWLDAHRFGLAISMDGPKAIHDLRRVTVGGRGSYDLVAKKVRMALDRYRSRPVGARVTLTAGVTDVEAIHHHLRDELGFAEVGYAPVTAGDNAIFNLNEAELAEVFAGFKRLGRAYRDAAIQGRNTGFSNLHQLMTDLHDGTRKALPCGAGVGMLAVDKDGDLNLCHRFTGSGLPTFGNVRDGIDKEMLGDFVGQRLDREGTHCASCHIRNLCAGGCYHESYARYGDPQHPTYHYCSVMRDWVDFGIAVYSEILAANPRFFDDHIAPRRGARMEA